MKKFKQIGLSYIVIFFLSIGFTGCNPFAEEEEEPINPSEFTYSTITSPTTGRIWMDRNLGAKRDCTSFDDSSCYGYYYQWGRGTDGHEESNSDTTSNIASSTTPAHGDIIASSSTYNYDWTTADSDGSIRSANWNPCPLEFRIPTIDELEDEGFSNREDAYNKLKIPVAGFRGQGGGAPGNKGSRGYLWSITPDNSTYEFLYAKALFVYSDEVFSGSMNPTSGHSIRCIKDADVAPQNQSPIADAGLNQEVTYIDTVYLDGSNSSDTDGWIETYQWKEDDTILSNNSSFSLSNLSVGDHAITLRVTDNDGATSTDTMLITVSEFIHNIVTGTITSPTGQVWMDKNLGANQVCTSFDDSSCYGDYYQWGRDTDGHEKSNSDTTPNIASSLYPDHGDFITIPQDDGNDDDEEDEYYNDWTALDIDGSIRSASWNPCPTGFRVPTISEINTENISDNEDAYDKLKLPTAGQRGYVSGEIYQETRVGRLWSSSASSTSAQYFWFDSYDALGSAVIRASGYNIRCIQN